MQLKLKQDPPVAKGKTFPFKISVVCWFDLLGYGRMIAEAGFNPLHPKASAAMKRLRRFHALASQHSFRRFPTLAINDGAAAYRDLSLRSRSVTHDFLVRAWNLFNAIQTDEANHGCPGVRAVLATGFRMHGRRAGMDATAAHFAAILRKYKQGEIGAEQAMLSAAAIRQPFDIVPQLQANFAFSKAYLAESGGSKMGLGGPNFYVDLAIFNAPTPTCVVLGKTIAWSHPSLGMNASFATLISVLPNANQDGGHADFRDGLQVAQHLSGD